MHPGGPMDDLGELPPEVTVERRLGDLEGVEVTLLEDDGAPRAEPGDELGDEEVAGRDVHEDGPGVDEVERAGGEALGDDVGLDHLEVGHVDAGQETGVEVDGHDGAVGPHGVTEPGRDRAGPAADLEATPTGLDSGPAQGFL